MSNIQYRLLRTGTGYHGSPTSVSTSGRYFYLVLTTRLPEKVNIRMSTSSTWWNQSCISAPLLEHLLSGECGLWTMPAGSPLPPQKDSMFCPVNWQKDCMSGNMCSKSSADQGDEKALTEPELGIWKSDSKIRSSSWSYVRFLVLHHFILLLWANSNKNCQGCHN